MKVGIIGAGAAGMMCAATLWEKAFTGDIHLLESNESMGKKVLITGGWRCNVTNNAFKGKEFLVKYPRWSDWAKNAFWKFSSKKTAEWFEMHGTQLKTEANGRMFPVSDSSKSIVGTFERIIRASDRIHFRPNTKIDSIERAEENDFIVRYESGNSERFDKIVIATWGSAYAKTWSEWAGHSFARQLWHRVTKLGPSLSGIGVSEQWPKELGWLSCERAIFSWQPNDGQTTTESTWGIVFTHYGISWPGAFAFSALTAYEPISETTPIWFRIVCWDKKTEEAWNAEIMKLCTENPKKNTSNILSEFMPKRLVECILRETRQDGETTASNLSKEVRSILSKTLANGLKLSYCHRRPGEEFVTAGGVDTGEVNPDTGESLLVPGLYFAGEVLNVDGVTGGFNLQFCWSSGRMVAESLIAVDRTIR